MRCAKCAEIWRVEPPTVPTPDASGTAADAPNPEPERTVRIDPLPRNRMPAPPSPPRRRFQPGGWALFLLVVAALAAGFYYGREPVQRIWPASAALYEAAGMAAADIGLKFSRSPLQVSGLKTAWVDTGGNLELVLKGSVRNDSDESVPAPFVRIRLFDGDEAIVRDKREPMQGGPFAPRESREFEMRFQDPGAVARALPVLEPIQ